VAGTVAHARSSFIAYDKQAAEVTALGTLGDNICYNVQLGILQLL
jgi:hypothetical protein